MPMKLHLLGVNGPFPESRGATSGYLLEAGDSLLQFDLGSGVLAALTALTAPESGQKAQMIWICDQHRACLFRAQYRLDRIQLFSVHQ